MTYILILCILRYEKKGKNNEENKNTKKTPKNDIGYGVKVAALKDMNVHNTDFDNINDGFFNDNYSDFDIEDF